jgi:hypothetical protein
VSPIDFVGELFLFRLDDDSNVAKTFLNQNGFKLNRDKILVNILSFLAFSKEHFLKFSSFAYIFKRFIPL